MGMMINRRRAYGGKKLPYDAEIEYLESSGTQYIKVPRIFGQILEFEITYTAIRFTTYGRCWIFGSWNRSEDAENGFSIDHYSKIRLIYSTTYPNFSANFFEVPSASLNTKYTIKINGNSLYVNNVELQNYDVPYYITEGNSICLLGVYTGSYALVSPQRINHFYLKTTNGTMDLIPVRIGNVGYMYDKVSGQLFGNQGTGDFILGPDV